MLWSEFKDSFLDWLGVHGGELHVAKAREVLGRFTRKMDPVQLSSVTQMTIHAYLAKRKGDPGRKAGTTVSAATLNGDICYLNMAFHYIEEIGRDALGLPVDWKIPKAKKLRLAKRIPVSLAQNEIDATFAATRHATKPEPALTGVPAAQWWTTFLLLALFTGIRKTGVLSLRRPDDASLNAGELVLEWSSNKSRADQTIYLPPICVEAIRRMPAAPGDVILHWPHGYRTFYVELQRFQEAGGVSPDRKTTPHQFRKTMATAMVRGGAGLSVVQRILGHSSPGVTQSFYVGLLTGEQRHAVDGIPIPAPLRAESERKEVPACTPSSLLAQV